MNLLIALQENPLASDSALADIMGVSQPTATSRLRELKEKVFALRGVLDRQLAVNESAQDLYQLLLGPCAALFNNVKHLVIIPHGSLHYLPFGVLQNELGQFVAMEYSMSLAPSASVLGFCLEKGEKYLGQDISQLPVLGFGNPALGDDEAV